MLPYSLKYKVWFVRILTQAFSLIDIEKERQIKGYFPIRKKYDECWEQKERKETLEKALDFNSFVYYLNISIRLFNKSYQTFTSEKALINTTP